LYKTGFRRRPLASNNRTSPFFFLSTLPFQKQTLDNFRSQLALEDVRLFEHHACDEAPGTELFKDQLIDPLQSGHL